MNLLAKVRDVLQFGSGGPRLGRNYLSTEGLDALNKAGDGFVAMRGASPDTDDGFVTKRYLEVRAGAVVTGQINGGSVAAVVNGAIYICTTAGGVYVLKTLYRGESGAWVAYTPFDGQSIKVTTALSGGTNTYSADHVYLWDATTSAWLDQGSSADLTTHAGLTAAHGATGAVVGTTNSQSLGAKTLDNTCTVNIKDTSLTVQAAGEATSRAQLLVSGVTAGQTRILTVQDKDITVADEAKKLEVRTVAITFSNTGANNVGAVVPAGAKVLAVLVKVTELFNGTSPTLSVGKAGAVDELQATTDNDLTKTGMNPVWALLTYASATQLIATLSVTGSPSTGACEIAIIFARA
jgi:hypothetical protein